MSLVIAEGLDKTGKTSVAKFFESLGFKIIHMSAPLKGTTKDQFLQEMTDIVSSAATADIFLDRSYYGETVWPHIYGRQPLIDEEDIESLREIENAVGVQRIWMTDDNLTAHWQRCVDNNEPLDKMQFTRARGLFSTMAQKYGFEKATLQTFLKQFPEAKRFVDEVAQEQTQQVPISIDSTGDAHVKRGQKTVQQHKLETANAINDIMSKRILKSKGSVYDGIENEIRVFLNDKLGKLLGGESSELTLSQDEIRFYKAMYKKANDKGAR